MAAYSTNFDGYLYTSVITPIASYCQAMGHPVTVDEIWSYIAKSPVSPAIVVLPTGATCQKRTLKTGRICGKPLVPGLNVCKRHNPKPIEPGHPLCQTILPAKRGGGPCGRPVYRTKEGTLISVCQYHRYPPPSPKRTQEAS